MYVASLATQHSYHDAINFARNVAGVETHPTLFFPFVSSVSSFIVLLCGSCEHTVISNLVRTLAVFVWKETLREYSWRQKRTQNYPVLNLARLVRFLNCQDFRQVRSC